MLVPPLKTLACQKLPAAGDPTLCCSLQVLTGLAAASSNGTNASQLRSAVNARTVMGLFRDLQGIAAATSSRRTYGALGPPPCRLPLAPLYCSILAACMSPGC